MGLGFSTVEFKARVVIVTYKSSAEINVVSLLLSPQSREVWFRCTLDIVTRSLLLQKFVKADKGIY